MVVTDETGRVSGAGLAGIAVLLLVAVFLLSHGTEKNEKMD